MPDVKRKLSGRKSTINTNRSVLQGNGKGHHEHISHLNTDINMYIYTVFCVRRRL